LGGLGAGRAQAPIRTSEKILVYCIGAKYI
jgi:hypothetical protein